MHSASGAELEHNAPARANGLPTLGAYGLPNPAVAYDGPPLHPCWLHLRNVVRLVVSHAFHFLTPLRRISAGL